MTHNATVVLESQSLLGEVCGVHDRNLVVIEELLGTRIVTRGNEFLLESSDEETKRILVRMLEELEAHVRRGETPVPDLIRAIHSAVINREEHKADLLRSAAIELTVGSKPVFPRTITQAEYIRAMERHDMVIGIGPAGTGKTYLAVAYALREVLGRQKRKLVLTRPVVEAGESLGFLPGDYTQKINPYLKPLFDAMEDLVTGELVQKLESGNMLEVAPLAYMRGRSLNNCFVILDEAQNTTREQMKMFLTRIGENSQAVITGDVTQIDLPRRKGSGLLHAARVLRSIPEIRFTYFSADDVQRNPLVRKIVSAYESETERTGP